ncbi:MAG: hypothetical protein EP330_29285 [Deltaproteobacteria bacterium]|nr:MAG: hypothetical protein EP330_29285 [Deltaproteobacteria bacterium]
MDTGLERAANHAPLLTLQGLVLADKGKGDEALRVLRKAESLRGDDDVLGARISLNTALVHMDLGAFGDAETALDEAASRAKAAGDDELSERVAENRAVLEAARGGGGRGDALAKVSEALRKGQTGAARESLPTAAEQDRRARVRRALAEGAILRAEGRFDEAALTLQSALTLAREGGLSRESAALLAEMGGVFRVGGRPALAREPLAEAVSMVAGSSFRLNEVAYRVEAGRVALALEDLESARGQLERARKAAKEVEDPTAEPRIDELEGAVLARAGDTHGAEVALSRAQAALELKDWHADAARVAVLRVELQAQMASKKLPKTRKEALDAFMRAGDSLGPVHVAMAEGVGLARAKQGADALQAFIEAADAAKAAGGARAEALQALARENAAQVLVSMGQNSEAAKAAAEHGLGDSVARLERFESAKDAYARGLKAFEGKKFATAQPLFHEAFESFEALGEKAYARQARAARAWATFNGGHTGKPETRMTLYSEVAQEAVLVEDPELEARALAAKALAADELAFGDVDEALRKALTATEQLGLHKVSGQLYAAVAEREGDLETRAGAARRAYDLLEGDVAGVYAAYSVAVDAYNGERPELAISLCELVVGKAGDLESDVKQVLEAARSQL